jgi:hypothetical protein
VLCTTMSSSMVSSFHDDESFFGLALSTNRRLLNDTSTTYFQYEALIAGIAIWFFRSTWTVSKQEPTALKWFFSFVLAFLAFSQKSYELIAAVELFSYAVPWLLHVNLSSSSWASWSSQQQQQQQSNSNNNNQKTQREETMIRLFLIALSGLACVGISSFVASGILVRMVVAITHPAVTRTLYALVPIAEISAAYTIMSHFQSPDTLRHHVCHLLFVTFHIQFAIGHLGIEFLTKEQHRRNQLVRMDTTGSNGTHDNRDDDDNNNNNNNSRKKKAQQFQRGAAPFIFFTAVPYMIQIILYGNINKFAYSCLEHDMHRAIRLHQLFAKDNHMLAVALNTESPTSPGAYATSMDAVVSTTYEMFNRKLFSLPKVILLPTVIMKTPMVMAQILPIIFVSDYLKGVIINHMTTRVESLRKQVRHLDDIRTKIESFDLKNAELLQRSGDVRSRHFTLERWQRLTVQIHSKQSVLELIERTKGFFSWIQRNFVFSVLVDCALANLIAVFKIVSAEIFVFSRAIEDAVDMVLMKSRSEAELARMMTEIEKLQQLAHLWDAAQKSSSTNLLHCVLAKDERDGITLRHVHYSRGSAVVHAEHVEMEPGIYALTGANGSGKLVQDSTANDSF